MTLDPAGTLKAVRAERCRRSLAEFVRHGWHVLEPGSPLTWNWHVDAVCRHIQASLEGWAKKRDDPNHEVPYQNLLINIPPGTGKSRLTSVFMPAWAWLRWPDWRSIFLSSNPRVALRDSVYCRDVIRSDWYRDWFRPAWELSADQDSKSLFNNTAGGSRMAMGFSSRVTGARADCIVVDDPHDAEEVHSEANRAEVRDRWDMAIANRLNDLRTSVRIGIMQRVHDEDWSGHVLKQGNWAHLCLRQEFEPGDDAPTPIGWRDPRTTPGELLFPERFPRDVLDAEKRRLGSFGYAGQHQQRPQPADGGHFKRPWFRYWKAEGEYARLLDREGRPFKLVRVKDCRRFGIVDLAFSLKREADFTVITVWAVTHDCDLIFLDMHRGRFEGPDLIPAIARMYERYGLDYVGIEEVAAQTLVVQQARRLALNVRGLKADRDKITRAIPATIRMEAGQIYLPADHPEIGVIEAELLSFPKGAHDDVVDCVAYAAAEVHRRGAGPETPEQKAAREAAEAEARAAAAEAWIDPANDDLWD